MKKTKFILVALVAVVLMSFAAEKFIVVKMTEEKMNFHWQNLNAIKQTVNNSGIPHNQAVYIIGSIDSLQKDIQLSASLDSTVTNPKK